MKIDPHASIDQSANMEELTSQLISFHKSGDIVGMAAVTCELQRRIAIGMEILLSCGCYPRWKR